MSRDRYAEACEVGRAAIDRGLAAGLSKRGRAALLAIVAEISLYSRTGDRLSVSRIAARSLLADGHARRAVAEVVEAGVVWRAGGGGRGRPAYLSLVSQEHAERGAGIGPTLAGVKGGGDRPHFGGESGADLDRKGGRESAPHREVTEKKAFARAREDGSGLAGEGRPDLSAEDGEGNGAVDLEAVAAAVSPAIAAAIRRTRRALRQDGEPS